MIRAWVCLVVRDLGVECSGFGGGGRGWVLGVKGLGFGGEGSVRKRGTANWALCHLHLPLRSINSLGGS